MGAVKKDAATSEIGSVSASGLNVLGWGTFIDDAEKAPDLLWPRSVQLYDLMRKDGQVKALLNGMILPITRYNWMIDPNGASDAAVKLLAEDLNLPVLGDKEPRNKGRSKRRFKFREHLKLTLRTGLVYGHSFSEKVGEYDEAGYWRLRKLGARMPKTINEIKTAPDGGLMWIKQDMGPEAKRIPVDHLACWVWEQDPGSWVGESFLRPMYKHWLRKDRLLRIDAMNIERNGMGVPIATAPAMATRGEKRSVLAALRAIVAGKDSGLVLPHGYDAKLKGVEGTLPDAIKSIQYDDEQMARTALMAFMQLGQTQSGSRALGETFVDFFALAQEACAYWYADTFNEHVIEDWMDINFGEDEAAPLLVFTRDESAELSVADIKAAIEAKLIKVDHEVRMWFADRFDLPEPEEDDEEDQDEPLEQPAPVALPVASIPVGATDPAVAARSAREGHGDPSPATFASPAGRFALPSRPMHRQPFDHEIAAEVDFATIEAEYEDSVTKMIEAYGPVRQSQIDEAIALIEAALDEDDLDLLAQIDVTPGGHQELMKILAPVVESSAAAAVAEGKAQGLDVSSIDTQAALQKVDDRVEGLTHVMAREFSAAAARQALNRVGGSLTPAEIGSQVRAHLEGLSDAYLRDQFGGSAQTAINAARMEVYIKNEAFERIYASELLDRNTCSVCANIDGQEYESSDAALADYPSAGYVSCVGGVRCRGTLVGVGGEG